MKNNTLAMIATIALVMAPASLIGYIPPATCTVANPSAFMTCEEAAAQHIWAFWGFGIFGLLVLFGPWVWKFATRLLASAKAKRSN